MEILVTSVTFGGSSVLAAYCLCVYLFVSKMTQNVTGGFREIWDDSGPRRLWDISKICSVELVYRYCISLLVL